MDSNSRGRAMTFAGALALALALGALARRAAAPPAPSEDMRDAVAAPMAPAALGGARVIRPDAGWFASPAGRRAEAERALASSNRGKSSGRARVRAARLRREAARERALAVAAQ